MTALANASPIDTIENTDTIENAETILNSVIDLAPEIKSYQSQIDQERRLPKQLVDALKNAGVFRMTMPQDWGGAELNPIEQLRIIETLAHIDASVGWCVMIGSDTGYFTGFIDQKVAKQMYPDINMITGAALTATGRAIKTKDGYRVSGHFPFSSGCHHSDWFVLGCQVFEGDNRQYLENGTPATLQCFVPAASVTILDTWDSTGLRGTGSNDLTVAEVFVPNERTFSYQDLHFYREGPLYQFPLNIIFNFSSVPLGVTQAALDAVIEAGERPSRITTINGIATPQRTLRDEAFVQDAVGRSRAMLGSARAYLYTTMEEFWDALTQRQEISPRLMADYQMTTTHVFETCTQAVELLYKVRGGSAVYRKNALDRCLRDTVTMNQHVMNSLRTYASAGRLLLGLPPENILL